MKKPNQPQWPTKKDFKKLERKIENQNFKLDFIEDRLNDLTEFKLNKKLRFRLKAHDLLATSISISAIAATIKYLFF
jgi:hypothetical protein